MSVTLDSPSLTRWHEEHLARRAKWEAIKPQDKQPAFRMVNRRPCVPPVPIVYAPLHQPLLSILRAVGKYKRVSEHDLLSDRRDLKTVRARQIAMYIARARTPRSFPEIGRVYKRDHATVISNIRKIEELLETDPGLNLDISFLMAAHD